MSFAIRASLCFLALSFNFVSPALGQPQSIPNQSASSETHDLAAALAGAVSEEERDLLLARKKDLMNSSLLVALRALSNPYVQKGDYAGALRISQLAVGIAERIGDRAGLGNALCDLGAIYDRQSRAAQALDCYQKALAIFEEAGAKKGKATALRRIGDTHESQKRYELALEYYGKSLAISEETGDRNAVALLLDKMGNAHDLLGHDDLGLELHQKSRAICEELNDKALLDIVLNNIAGHYIALGRYADALECLHKGLKIIEERGSDGNKRSLAIRLLNIGLIYRRQGRPDQALAYYHKSLKLMEEVGEKFGVANLQNNIGVVYKSQGLYDEALEWFQKSLRRYEEIPTKGGVSRSLNNIGDLYRLQGRYNQALENLRKSLQLREENRDREGIILTLKNLGWLYQDQGKYAEMLEISQRAAGLAEQIIYPEGLWEAQDLIGRAFHALGRPAEARRSFLAAIAIVESLRHEVAGGEQQRQSFLEKRHSPWLGMVALLVSQHEYAEALTFAERSKARVLLDALQAGRAGLREALAPRERQAEEERRHRLVSLNSQLTSELRRDKPDPSRVAELKASVEKARLDYEDLETSLYVAHPELRTHWGEAPIIKVEDLAALLPNAASALLEYVVADDVTYLFAVTKSVGKTDVEIRVYTLPVKRNDLAEQTEAFRRQLAARDLGFRASAARLYSLLLKPAEAQLRGKTNLVIAPDDKLWDLPFQALLASPNRFLIEDAAISYAPSLTALREMTKRRKNQGAPSSPATLLALGNPQLGRETLDRAALSRRDEKLDPLPEAEHEVEALGRLYGASRSKVYVGADAREDRVKNEAGQATILHFATHGILNDASPMYSHLALAQGDTNEDGLLEAWEVMRLNLKADLVALSACETARGRYGAGEGIIGLAWALFVAGAPSVVVSQWKVESASARDLMLGFHGQLRAPASAKAKMTKAEALRRAALKVMKNPETGHPFYWAGFVLVGAS